MNEILAIIIGVLGLILGVGAAAKSGEKNANVKRVQKAGEKATESQLDAVEKVAEVEAQKEQDLKEAETMTDTERAKKLNGKIKDWNTSART